MSGLYLFTCRRHQRDNCEVRLCVVTDFETEVRDAEQRLAIVEAAYAAWIVADTEDRQHSIVESLGKLNAASRSPRS